MHARQKSTLTKIELILITFPPNALPRDLESFLSEVRQNPGQALKMPITFKWGGGYGGAVQAIQTIATWARLNDGPRTLVLPPAFAEQENSRDRFASTLPGMAALYFADVVKSGSQTFTRFEALRAVSPRVAAMQKAEFQDTLRGQGLALCCFGGARSEFLPSLYEHQSLGGVRSLSGFHLLVPRLLASLGGNIAERITEGQLQHLSHLVYELFSNTDEHGSFDAQGRGLRTSIRGISARLTTLSNVTNLIKATGDDVALKGYIAKASVLPVEFTAIGTTAAVNTAENAAQIVEISVFDSGPGLALRWLAKEREFTDYSQFSLDEEIASVETCFKKHATTRAPQGMGGQGLTQAVLVLRKLRAFMTLRSGRLSLYQDFSRGNAVDLRPSHRFARRQKLPEIAGTSFTVLFKVK